MCMYFTVSTKQDTIMKPAQVGRMFSASRLMQDFSNVFDLIVNSTLKTKQNHCMDLYGTMAQGTKE